MRDSDRLRVALVLAARIHEEAADELEYRRFATTGEQKAQALQVRATHHRLRAVNLMAKARS